MGVDRALDPQRLLSGAVSKLTPARSLTGLSFRHGLPGKTALMMPAVHWLADRVQSPVTGSGGTVDVPGWAPEAPDRRAAADEAVPERR